MSRNAPIDRLLGIEPAGPDQVTLAPQPPLMNHRAGFHGAAVSALLEAAAVAAVRAQGPGWQAARTRDLHVSFLRPGQGLLHARARVTGGGKSLCFCEAAVHDDQGRAVAQALLTVTAS